MFDSQEIEQLTEQFCDHYCKYPEMFKDQNELDDICDSCPINQLADELL